MFVETRKYTRIRLEGTDLLKRLGVIYSQIVNDLLMKVDDGNGNYPRGFLHTSTTPLSVPNYYDQMWSRDVGRGIQELVECGLIEDARSVVECVFGYGTYGAMIAALSFREMADVCKDQERNLWLGGLADRFREALLGRLLSRGSGGDQKTKTPAGVWLNGIDERTGLAAETGRFWPGI